MLLAKSDIKFLTPKNRAASGRGESRKKYLKLVGQREKQSRALFSLPGSLHQSYRINVVMRTNQIY
jgi:hypothetical protein